MCVWVFESVCIGVHMVAILVILCTILTRVMVIICQFKYFDAHTHAHTHTNKYTHTHKQTLHRDSETAQTRMPLLHSLSPSYPSYFPQKTSVLLPLSPRTAHFLLPSTAPPPPFSLFFPPQSWLLLPWFLSIREGSSQAPAHNEA